MANRKRRKRIQHARKQQDIFLHGSAGTANAEVYLLQSSAFTLPELRVDTEAGIIHDAAILSAGIASPVNGKIFEVDRVMLQQVVDSINANTNGVRCRITHPELSETPLTGMKDDILMLVGRVKNARVVGDQVRGDVHVAEYANHSPNGEMRKYLLGVAKDDPAAIGLSIRFIPARSELRTNQPELRRVSRVTAVDFVGTPGGNPNGLLAGSDMNHHQPEGSGAARYGEPIMNEQQRKYLVSLGMKATASDAEAEQYLAGLTGDAKDIALALARGDEDDDETKSATGGKKTPAKKPAGGDGTQSLAGSTTGGQASQGGEQKNPEQIAQETLAADQKRRNDIMSLAKEKKLDESWAQGLCDRRVTLAEAQNLASLAEAMPAANVGIGSRFEVGDDRNLTSLAEGMSDAIMLRAGVQLVEIDPEFGTVRRDAERRLILRKPHDRSAKFQNLSLFRMAQMYLRHVGLGDEVDSLGDTQMLELAMNPQRLAKRTGNVQFLAMGTGDFPYILENTIRKVVRTMYGEMEPQVTWPLWCQKDTSPDFKEKSLVALSEAPNLLERSEGEGVHYAYLKETRERVALSEFDRGLRITSRAIKNDDQGVFNKVPRMLVSAARRKEDDLPYAVVTANAPMSDGTALFHEDHNNLAAVTGAPSIATLTAGFTAMSTQTGLLDEVDGDGGPAVLDIEPRIILTPRCLQIPTEQLIASSVDPTKNNNVPNPFANRLKVIGNSRLDRSSSTAWYLAGDPYGPGGGVVLVFLLGEEAPKVSSEVDFDTNDLKIKVEHNLAAKASDHRGLYKNDGTAEE